VIEDERSATVVEIHNGVKGNRNKV